MVVLIMHMMEPCISWFLLTVDVFWGIVSFPSQHQTSSRKQVSAAKVTNLLFPSSLISVRKHEPLLAGERKLQVIHPDSFHLFICAVLSLQYPV